ncbi:transferrin-binding protein-like solute binding protein [Neisseria sp.]|uniref:transferrin-binding protein-like solute binding protein n=1 Tax=Neisseria sp. TaxID=192066 RepID=UPI0035A09FE5
MFICYSGTDAVPTSGKATYAGLASYGFANTAFLKGKSDFTVDFGAKTIDGAIQRGTVSEVLLSGKINGASFSGTKDGVTMNGNFFGPKAAELGGVYKGERYDNLTNNFETVMGAFGAKKQ